MIQHLYQGYSDYISKKSLCGQDDAVGVGPCVACFILRKPESNYILRTQQRDFYLSPLNGKDRYFVLPESIL